MIEGVSSKEIEFWKQLSGETYDTKNRKFVWPKRNPSNFTETFTYLPKRLRDHAYLTITGDMSWNVFVQLFLGYLLLIALLYLQTYKVCAETLS